MYNAQIYSVPLSDTAIRPESTLLSRGEAAPSRPQKTQRTLTSAASNIPVRVCVCARACLRACLYIWRHASFSSGNRAPFFMSSSLSLYLGRAGMAGAFFGRGISPRGRKLRRGLEREIGTGRETLRGRAAEAGG